ncbi:MAG: type 4a pilus biogenesis protein PilO [Elusimicrobiota bacterium]|nr:type 4a pilus biogenesis protein PilO [Elusimicrobiota bacterium]
MAQNIDLKPLVALAQAELDMVLSTVREKGGKRFGKAFALAGVMVVLAYAGLYAPPKKKSARLQSEIDAARQLSEFGTQYKDLRDQLASGYAQLPTMKEKEQWLSNSVYDSLKAEGLAPETFQPVREQEQAGLIFQASNITMPARFAEFYAWLTRLEGAKPLMHLQSVDLNKKSDAVGLNTVQAEIVTVIPKRRFN